MEFEIHILAGGKSSRMGQDKGLMEYKGIPMIQHIIDTCEKLDDSIKIITNNYAYKKFGKEIISDNFSSIGPIGGIQAGLNKSKEDHVLFLPCDVPHISFEVLDELESCAEEGVITIACDSVGLQPLIGFYPKSILPKIETHIKEEKYKITHLFDSIPYKVVNFETAPSINFKNINSEVDL
ncbi:MAG: molybdenum cofactor guanylyltransferase [Crocinitomicaceae bacterium]|nr:molybdenum cofactor guanylyltransferase [Crocinitomicaceae bacterium]